MTSDATEEPTSSTAPPSQPKLKPEPEGDFVVSFFGACTVNVGARGHEVVGYGRELRVTPALRALNAGQSWLALLDDPEGQRRRWGQERVRPGAWPEGVPRQEPGTLDFDDAREAARQAAHRIEDPAKKAAALDRVRELYGSKSTSRTIAVYGS